MFWSTVGRMIVVPLAFLISAGFALFVLLSLGLERATQVVHAQARDDVDVMFGFVRLFRDGVVLTSGLSIVPALLVVIFGEVARIRSALYYIIGGGVALAAVPLLAYLNPLPGVLLPAPTVWPVFATAGFAGGFLYWLMAGRRA
jgi:hypothetical protein